MRRQSLALALLVTLAPCLPAAEALAAPGEASTDGASGDRSPTGSARDLDLERRHESLSKLAATRQILRSRGASEEAIAWIAKEIETRFIDQGIYPDFDRVLERGRVLAEDREYTADELATMAEYYERFVGEMVGWWDSEGESKAAESPSGNRLESKAIGCNQCDYQFSFCMQTVSQFYEDCLAYGGIGRDECFRFFVELLLTCFDTFSECTGICAV